MIVITGWRSRVAEEFRGLLRFGEDPVWGKPLEPGFPIHADRYLFCQGLLRPARAADQTAEEIAESVAVNYESIVLACDRIIQKVNGVRICIIGSESAYRGSFDETYGMAKASLHQYIETVRLRTAFQQIVGISPGIIEDAGMTTRRDDQDGLRARRAAHPKHRFVTSAEIAHLAKTLLYGPTDYISGTIIRMHGGLPS